MKKFYENPNVEVVEIKSDFIVMSSETDDDGDINLGGKSGNVLGGN